MCVCVSGWKCTQTRRVRPNHRVLGGAGTAPRRQHPTLQSPREPIEVVLLSVESEGETPTEACFTSCLSTRARLERDSVRVRKSAPSRERKHTIDCKTGRGRQPPNGRSRTERSDRSASANFPCVRNRKKKPRMQKVYREHRQAQINQSVPSECE